MKNTTIYLANITKASYTADIVTVAYATVTVACEAFSTIEKAEAFMFSEGMSKAGSGLWEKDESYDYSGEIIEMKVK